MEENKHTTIILFGISGDLSKRKILPSLLHLSALNMLPINFNLLGVSRKKLQVIDILNSENFIIDNQTLSHFSSRTSMLKMNTESLGDFELLQATLDSLDKTYANKERMFYLSVPPETLPKLIELLGKTKNKECATKLIFEKPFGVDETSARALIKLTSQYFTKSEIYHIDHYIAKPLVQKISEWKETLSGFQNILSKKYIKKIEIISSESLGVEKRAAFYDTTGALRDLIQSHLLAVLARLIKTPGQSIDTCLQALTLAPEDAKRAQYASYTEDIGKPSTIETFAECTFYSSHFALQDIPFVLVTGKAMDKKLFRINLFLQDSVSREGLIMIDIHPHLEMSYPDDLPLLLLEVVKNIQNDISTMTHDRDEYMILFMALFGGDKNLFIADEEIRTTWTLVDPITMYWKSSVAPLYIYPSKSSLEEIRNLYENN